MTERDPWQTAYLRFETPEQERRKFVKRLNQLGARTWPADAAVVELCCGRGSGLAALESLGFTRIEGIDIAADLLEHYRGAAVCHVADCRALPFDDGSKDVVVVHGGMHHLIDLPDDLRRTVVEVHRVLKDNGRFVLVEPWLTPFLRFVHAAGRRPVLRRGWGKLDALMTMIEHERITYEQWLAQPHSVRLIVGEQFTTEWEAVRFGKWSYQGRKRVQGDSP